ncbi:MAG: aldehyde dehydrogenase family protein [Chlamydiae bacterium]|nr:aldehyde dehydrogenase family protein [Chlamydiota bacterium]
MQKAFEILDLSRGKISSLEEREKLAVDLAGYLLEEANKTQTYSEKRNQQQLARMMKDPVGKAFTTCMTDQGFRSNLSPRVANQINYLIDKFGVPQYFDPLKRIQLSAFRLLSPVISHILVPLVTFMLRRETSSVILPGEHAALSKHMKLRREQGVRINLNHLGEAILGEKEAKRRLQVYLDDLKKEDVEYISVKISTIYSQINLLAWDKTVDSVASRLKELYRAAMNNTFTRADGTVVKKFVNLDMEEYKDLLLTKDIFKKVLDEKEFQQFSAGIVLQAYLPDSYAIQKELTEWAMKRIQAGGASIKIRIVKGANLAMEQFEASLRLWPQAPYKHKSEVDANFKRMVSYGSIPEHAKAVHLGIGSHNLFDIAYAMLLRAEYKSEAYISFEMLEGMADHIRRVVQRLSGDMLLYCPVAVKEDFQSAIAYLIRRLDENTGPENFLRYTFGLKPGSPEWQSQVQLFTKACSEMEKTLDMPRRNQNRFDPAIYLSPKDPFEGESDTDFSLAANRKWAQEIIQKWHKKPISPIPCVIDGKEYHETSPQGEGIDPSYPQDPLYKFSMASWDQVNEAIESAKKEESSWANLSVEKKAELFAKAAHLFREKRGDLIGAMMADGGKTVLEGDPEISEAIDFIEYYSRAMLKMHACHDIEWQPKGTVLITPPWNFPVSIPVGGIIAALATGNCVLFKPAPEAVLSGWELAKLLWEAGIPKKALQFFSCHDEPIGSQLIADQRVSAIILTGATSTAKLFQKLKPGLDLSAETGGKNAMIVTSMADRDLAIKDLIHSAFGHSGQKCSAASLGILEAEIYDNPHFLAQLKDAAESLKVGSAWDLSSKVTPIIREASPALLKGLTQLEAGETWLVEPKQDPKNPQLWSPGIKLGVKENSFMHHTELFGPILGLMRAKNLDHAIELANGTEYGLTSGISSLDEREHDIWLSKIEAGNCYINRTITGAIVKRQPFGGCKASSFGHGSKAGGPNYLFQFALPLQKELPQEKHPVCETVNKLTGFLQKISLSTEELGTWYGSVANYAYWGEKFKQTYSHNNIDGQGDLVVGQDNKLIYRPHKKMAFRIQKSDSALDIFRVIAAAITTHTNLEVSYTAAECAVAFNDQWRHQFPSLHFKEESENVFIDKIKKSKFSKIRLITKPTDKMIISAAEVSCFLNYNPVLANGRIELLNYLREMALSVDYHRYGNLGVREAEHRNPIL